MQTESTTSAPPYGPSLDVIANDLVSLHKVTCGRGPERARAQLTDDMLVCVLRDGFTTAEESLIRHGRGDTVIGHRARLHDTMRSPAIAIVERALGREVDTLLHSVEPDKRIEALIFILGEDGTAEDAGATVRAGARETRREHRRLSDENRALRAERDQRLRKLGQTVDSLGGDGS
jgi:uncharacterized protein YbcI